LGFDFSTFLDTAAAAVLPALGLVVLGVLLGVFVPHAGHLCEQYRQILNSIY
jgi:hypothetical protein